MEAWNKARVIALDGENWCKVLHGRLVAIPGGTAKEDEMINLLLMNVERLSLSSRAFTRTRELISTVRNGLKSK